MYMGCIKTIRTKSFPTTQGVFSFSFKLLYISIHKLLSMLLKSGVPNECILLRILFNVPNIGPFFGSGPRGNSDSLNCFTG